MRLAPKRAAISVAIAIVLCSIRAWSQPLTAAPANPSNLLVRLNQVVNAGAALIDVATIPGDGKLYIAVYSSSPRIVIVDPVAKTISATAFLSFSDFPTVPVTGQAVQGITFSPNYNDSTKPGYHKFYTYEEETTPGATNMMFLHPEVANPANVGVLREWTANSSGTAIDATISPRVVLNFGTPAGHMGGGLKFGPDGLLYLSTGDGGGSGDGYSGSQANAGDGFTGRGGATPVPAISNGQDFTNVLGKVVRIDPYVTNGDGSSRTPSGETPKIFNSQTAYFIPNSNPFATVTSNTAYFTNLGPVGSATPSPPLGEIYAFGFRNPWKLSFDKNAAPGDGPYVADVGSHTREEIDVIEAGRDYGWPYREGNVISATAAAPGGTARPGSPNGPIPFLKQTNPGVFVQYDLDPTLTDPTQMHNPIAELGTRSGSGNPPTFADKPGNDLFGDGIYGNAYGDTNAVVGGYVYRGSAIPQLVAKYVFGGYQYLVDDPSRDPATYPAMSGGGTLYYFDLMEMGVPPGGPFTVRKLNVSGFTPINGRTVTSLSQDIAGEMYVLFDNGDVVRIAKAGLLDVLYPQLRWWITFILVMFVGLVIFAYGKWKHAARQTP